MLMILIIKQLQGQTTACSVPGRSHTDAVASARGIFQFRITNTVGLDKSTATAGQVQTQQISLRSLNNKYLNES